MVPKAERFEMRMDEDILARVDKWRSQQGDVPTRAGAVRKLIELSLSKTSGDTVSFSDGEKLLIVMMGDIYRHLNLARGEIDPEFVSEVIWGGHYWAPKWEMQGLFHDHEDDPRYVRFVVDVLDMWNFIENAHAKLSKKDKERVEKEAEPFGKHVQFMGFDGNNETTHMGIAQFLIEKMNRFSKFKGRDLNSHMPTLGTYRKMLSVFEPMRVKLVGAELDATQLISIMKARMYSA